MSKSENGIISKLENLLQKDYRGVNIAVYALATATLAVSIHKIRPISKFSKASKVPNHFLKNHEPLCGTYVGVQHSPVRLLINHKAPIYLPLWHSSKPPLPVKLWGVDVVSGNAVSWLECVAKGHKVTLKPISRENEDLVSTVLLHLPQKKANTVEMLDIGQKLVQLGFAKASIPNNLQKNSLESQIAPSILCAQEAAKNYRKGIWSESLPPLPAYVIYWRKGSQVFTDFLLFTAKGMLHLSTFAFKSILVGGKNLLLRPFRSQKQIQPS